MLVGREEVKFVVHQDAVCKRSKFFAATFSKRWNDAQTPIKLPEDSAETFSRYLEHVYGGNLDKYMTHGNHTEKLTTDDERGSYVMPFRQSEVPVERLVRLYALSDKLGDLDLANEVMDTIYVFHDDSETLPSPDIVRLVWDTTPENSPLHRYMRDSWVWRASEFALEEEHWWTIPKPFLLAVVQEHRRVLRDIETGVDRYNVFYAKQRDEEKLCRYHQHNDSCPPCEIKSQEGTAEAGT